MKDDTFLKFIKVNLRVYWKKYSRCTIKLASGKMSRYTFLVSFDSESYVLEATKQASKYFWRWFLVFFLRVSRSEIKILNGFNSALQPKLKKHNDCYFSLALQRKFSFFFFNNSWTYNLKKKNTSKLWWFPDKLHFRKRKKNLQNLEIEPLTARRSWREKRRLVMTLHRK